MRGGHHLRAVRKDEEEIHEPVYSVKKPVSNEIIPSNNVVTDFLRDMERTMFESFWRPLRGMGGHALRDVLNETSNYAMSPAVDMFEREGKLVVKADLPGFAREDIEVRVFENNLEIKGERKSEEEINRKNYMKIERTFGSFKRVLKLPENANSNKVDATFKDGVLELIMPLAEVVDNSRKIEIK